MNWDAPPLEVPGGPVSVLGPEDPLLTAVKILAIVIALAGLLVWICEQERQRGG